MPPKKRQPTKFRAELEITHGIFPPADGSSPCTFCLSFGRESPPEAVQSEGAVGSTENNEAQSSVGPKPKKPRRMSTAILHFDDFSRHRIEKHYTTCHPAKWQQYLNEQERSGLSKQTNQLFFSKEKITAHFARRDPGDKAVKVSHDVGKLTQEFYSEEDAGDTRYREELLLCYGEDSEAVDDLEELSDADYESLHYVAIIPSHATFSHVINLVSYSLSFKQISRVIAEERELFAEARKRFPYVHRGEAALYTRLVAMLGLNALSKILRQCWTYSLAADASTAIMGTAYFDVMVRVPPFRSGGDVTLLHVMAPPLRGSHTGESMFTATDRVFSSLDPLWKEKMMGSTSDGAANMTGCDLGWQTRLENASLESGETAFFKNHCGPHKLNLIVGKSIDALKETESKFMSILYEVIKFTRAEDNLIEEMKCQSPYHQKVRWSSLGAVLSWYRKHQEKLEGHYVSKDKEIAENTCWWLTLTALQVHFKILGICFASLQNETLLMESQLQLFKSLLDDLQNAHHLVRSDIVQSRQDLSSHLEAVDSGEQPEARPLVWQDDVQPPKISEVREGSSTKLCLGAWSVSFESIWNSLPDIGLDARELHDTIDKDDQKEDRLLSIDTVCRDIGYVGLSTVYFLEKIIEEEEKRRTPPPSMPLALAELKAFEFQDIILSVKKRLAVTLGPDAASDACLEHQELTRDVSRNRALRQQFSNAAKKHTRTFSEYWAPAGNRYTNLRMVAAGFATVFPGSSPVESEFSLVKLDKRPQRSRLADLCVEGSLHARQWTRLSDLEALANSFSDA